MTPPMPLLMVQDKSNNPSAADPSSSSSEKKAPLKTTLYKTELCKRYSETGLCRYGTKCQFAHGMNELRNVLRHPKYKTTKCNSYWTTGTCPYGSRCRFLHDEMSPTTESLMEPSSSLSGGTIGPTATTGTVRNDEDGREQKRLPLYMRECKHISYLSLKEQPSQQEEPESSPAVIVSANGTMTSFDESYRTGYQLWRTKGNSSTGGAFDGWTKAHQDDTLFRRECRHLESTATGEDYRKQYHEWRKTKIPFSDSDVMSVLSDSVEALIQFD